MVCCVYADNSNLIIKDKFCNKIVFLKPRFFEHNTLRWKQPVAVNQILYLFQQSKRTKS